MGSFADFRIQKDIENLCVTVSQKQLVGKVFCFELNINTDLYQNKYKFEVIFSEKYPFQSPRVYCRTPTFHPNIYNESVCLKILRLGWLPSYDLNSIVTGVIEMFEDFSIEDPFNTDAADLYRQNIQLFKTKIKDVERGHENGL